MPTSVFRSAWIYLAFVTLGGADHVYSIAINAFDISGAVLIPLGKRTGWGGGLQWGGRREEAGAAGG